MIFLWFGGCLRQPPEENHRSTALFDVAYHLASPDDWFGHIESLLYFPSENTGRLQMWPDEPTGSSGSATSSVLSRRWPEDLSSTDLLARPPPRVLLRCRNCSNFGNILTCADRSHSGPKGPSFDAHDPSDHGRFQIIKFEEFYNLIVDGL